MTKQSTITWYDDGKRKPDPGELVLAQHKNGDRAIMFWRDDAGMWDDPEWGFYDAAAIIAWSPLPNYEIAMEVNA